jgi:hypothetical protein
MGISIFPVTPRFAAEVGDIDLSKPLDAETLQDVRDTFGTRERASAAAVDY